jgi:hemin uptake protein HemP
MKRTTDTVSRDSRYLILDREQPIPSEHLFSATEEVRIRHRGEEYRLRRTRAGKLILTK